MDLYCPIADKRIYHFSLLEPATDTNLKNKE
jgi:hypothetical protein